LARVRVRQHVNPLSQTYRQPIALPDWSVVYARPNRPIVLDVGAGRGRFLWAFAQRDPGRNFLGLEIREPLVAEANRWRDAARLTNLHYLFCNVDVSLRAVLASLPAGAVETVAIQFPDPWFKKRHAKRRMVKPELVAALADCMPGGGTVVLQSDVASVACDIRDRFGEHPDFRQCHTEPWLPATPFPVETERERATLARGQPVYRAAFKRLAR